MRMSVVRVLRRRVGRMGQLGAVGAREGAEVVVEAVVLLNEEHDVLDRARHRGTAASTPGARLGFGFGLCVRLCSRFWLGFWFWFGLCFRLGFCFRRVTHGFSASLFFLRAMGSRRIPLPELMAEE